MMAACFWLLAIVILIMMGEAAFGIIGCGWLVLSGKEPVGTCNTAGIIAQTRELMSEALTAVLALLLAARKPPNDGG
jgi:hypothetical protein